MKKRHAYIPIEAAPTDGTEIIAIVGGRSKRGEFLIKWQTGFESESDPYGSPCWIYVGDGIAPVSWDDGVCWAKNAAGERSSPPLMWRKPNEGERP